MFTVRRHEERTPRGHGKHEGWLTFSPANAADPLAGGLGSLEILSEDRLLPGAAVPAEPAHDSEIVTFVREGAVAYRDSTGRSGVISAGEFQRLTSSRGVRHEASNASRVDGAHVFQIWLRLSRADLESTQEQKRFSTAERRSGLCVVAAPNAQRGSLRVHPDALVYSALLEPGQHVVHELAHDRSAWLHLVEGEAALGDLVLSTGDGVAIELDRAVSVTARKATELLLIDVSNPRSLRRDSGSNGGPAETI